MNARVRLPMSHQTKKMVDDVISAAEETIREDQNKAICRVIKLSCLILNEEYGFGKKRLNEFIEEMGSRVSVTAATPEQWYLLDEKLERLGVFLPKEDITEREQHSRDLYHEKGRKFREYGGKQNEK